MFSFSSLLRGIKPSHNLTVGVFFLIDPRRARIDNETRIISKNNSTFWVFPYPKGSLTPFYWNFYECDPLGEQHLPGCSTTERQDWLIDWLIDCLIGWLIDWLIDWLIACLIGWLIDWVPKSLGVNPDWIPKESRCLSRLGEWLVWVVKNIFFFCGPSTSQSGWRLVMISIETTWTTRDYYMQIPHTSTIERNVLWLAVPDSVLKRPSVVRFQSLRFCATLTACGSRTSQQASCARCTANFVMWTAHSIHAWTFTS